MQPYGPCGCYFSFILNIVFVLYPPSITTTTQRKPHGMATSSAKQNIAAWKRQMRVTSSVMVGTSIRVGVKGAPLGVLKSL